MRAVRLGILALLCTAGGIPQVLADHLDASEVARGKPEHILAGINVYDDNIKTVIKRIGKPEKFTSITTADDPPGSGERTYEWNRDGIRLRVGTEFRTDEKSKKVVESAPEFVDVWGAQKGTFGFTSRGLALGSDVVAIRKIYGPRFLVGDRYATVQWEDETTLDIDLDKEGRIIHMQLAADVE